MGGPKSAGIPASACEPPRFFTTENKSSETVEIIGKLGEKYIWFGMWGLGCDEEGGGVDKGQGTTNRGREGVVGFLRGLKAPAPFVCLRRG
jgi:hypothetical protein